MFTINSVNFIILPSVSTITNLPVLLVHTPTTNYQTSNNNNCTSVLLLVLSMLLLYVVQQKNYKLNHQANE